MVTQPKVSKVLPPIHDCAIEMDQSKNYKKLQRTTKICLYLGGLYILLNKLTRISAKYLAGKRTWVNIYMHHYKENKCHVNFKFQL
jgi:hypothetical protein